MKRNWVKLSALFGAAASGILAAGAGGCAIDVNPYLIITRLGNVELDGDACGPSESLVPSPVFDAGVAAQQEVRARALGRYVFGIDLVNELEENSDEDTEGTTTGRLDRNKIQLTEVEVTFDNQNPWGFLPEKLTAGLGNVIGPGDELRFLAVAIDEQTAALMVESAGTPIDNVGESFPLNLSVMVRGTLLDGTVVESNRVELTVTICNRCLYLNPEVDLAIDQLCGGLGASICGTVAQAGSVSCGG